MILFLNVFITEKRLNNYFRGNLPLSNRFDVFKYTLSSLSVLDCLSKIIIYCELDEEYKPREEELKKFIYSIYNKEKVSFYSYRNSHQKDWQRAAEEVFAIDDNLIWFSCNDDHVFIDYDLEMVNRIVSLMEKDSYPHLTCYYSHWPELIRVAAKYNPIKIDDYFMSIHWDVHDAVQIINKNLFKTWWFDYNYGDFRLVRVDYIKDLTHHPVKCFIPLREMCRHLDGYSHAQIDANICSPLAIPCGFFDNEIRILYGSTKREEGFTHLSPLQKDYFVFNALGTDYKWVLQDLPLFWRKKVSEIKFADEISTKENLIKGRNNSIRDMIHCHISSGWTVPMDPRLPEEWFKIGMK